MKFFRKLISNSQEVSSRRLIALLTLPSYIVGIFVGIFSNVFQYYITAMVAAGAPILLAFFALTWENIKDILSSAAFKRGQDLFSEDELKDP